MNLGEVTPKSPASSAARSGQLVSFGTGLSSKSGPAQASNRSSSSTGAAQEDQASNRDSEFSLGQKVMVTADEQHLEKCVREVGMQWPMGPSGRPWSRKLGLTGKIMRVDYNDCTVELDDGKGWVPIRALAGYENWSSGESESEEEAPTRAPQSPPKQPPPKQLPQESQFDPAPRSSTTLPEKRPSPSAKEQPRRPSDPAAMKLPPSPKVLAAPKKLSQQTKSPDNSLESSPRIDPEVTPEVTGLDQQPNPPSKKGKRLSSQSRNSRASTSITGNDAMPVKTRSMPVKTRWSRCSLFSMKEEDSGEEAAAPPPISRPKSRSKVKVKKRANSRKTGELQQVKATAEKLGRLIDDSTLNSGSGLNGDSLKACDGLPTKLESPGTFSGARLSMAASTFSDSDDSMDGTIAVSTTCKADGAVSSSRSTSLCSKSAFDPKEISQSRRSSLLSDSSIFEDGPEGDMAMVQGAKKPKSLGSLGSLGTLLDEPLTTPLSVKSTCTSFWSSPENSDEDKPKAAPHEVMSKRGSDCTTTSYATSKDSPKSRFDSTWESAVSLNTGDDTPTSPSLDNSIGRVASSITPPTGTPQTIMEDEHCAETPKEQEFFEKASDEQPAGFAMDKTSSYDVLASHHCTPARISVAAFHREDEDIEGQGRPSMHVASFGGVALTEEVDSHENVSGSAMFPSTAPTHASQESDTQSHEGKSPEVNVGRQNHDTKAEGREDAGTIVPEKPMTSSMKLLTVPQERKSDLDLFGDSEEESDALEEAGLEVMRQNSNRRRTEEPATLSGSDTRGSLPWNLASSGPMVVHSNSRKNADPTMSRHINWRMSRVNSVCESNLLQQAMARVATSDKAMNPERAQSGLSLLRRMKQLLETQDFDDTLGIKTIENIFFDSIPRKHVEIKSIEQVLRIDLLKRFLRKVSEESASIEATFHGTREEYVKDILDVGLNPNLCATGAYGRGAYVGTHAGVAHQYADPNEEGWRHMCVILVVVGRAVVKGKEGEQCPSTALDSLVNPTQYCFVEEDRLYCSHLITYRVVKTNNRRTGGGWEDPFQRKLTCAVSKAAKQRNKSGIR